jgi:hypothetical protein
MNICQHCWTANGRLLSQNQCICTGDVPSNSEFHARMIKKRIPYNLPREKEAPKAEVKRRLVFGEKAD